MAKKSKFIRLHGAKDQAIASVRRSRIVAIIDMGGHRKVMLAGSASVDVYDETSEIIMLIDGIKRVKEQKDEKV